ncbi:hypothetical protein BH24ACT5_BH24ACT5_25090 [soil metagenome]
MTLDPGDPVRAPTADEDVARLELVGMDGGHGPSSLLIVPALPGASIGFDGATASKVPLRCRLRSSPLIKGLDDSV